MKCRVHAWIEGRVQGVCFRYYARERAEELGLCGWVRNLSDGRVETLVEGERDGVDNFMDWCRKGPPSAIVRNVELRIEPVTGEFASFEIDYGC
jgi:acylphosphatase